MKRYMVSFFALILVVRTQAIEVSDIIVRQQWPWSSDVAVDFSVTKCGSCFNPVSLAAYDGSTKLGDINYAFLSGDAIVKSEGYKRVSFNPSKIPFLASRGKISDFRIEVSVEDSTWLYMVVDLESGKRTYISEDDLHSGAYGSVATNPVPGVTSLAWTGVTNDVAYKTTKMVFRFIPAGTFTQGSPVTEFQRSPTEYEHQTSITEPFWAAIFECTVAQYRAVFGSRPSQNWSFVEPLDHTPCSAVTYDMLRGETLGTNYPSSTEVDSSSFFGVMRVKTGLDFDLPTCSQWEYACRAGTTGSVWNNNCPILETLNNSADASDANLDLVGWNGSNSNEKRHPVGLLAGNAWGIYDMHGNILEWCLDKGLNNNLGYPNADPVSGERGWPGWPDNLASFNGKWFRCQRGGSFEKESGRGPIKCRAASVMLSQASVISYALGFRIFCQAR